MSSDLTLYARVSEDPKPALSSSTPDVYKKTKDSRRAKKSSEPAKIGRVLVISVRGWLTSR